VAVLCPTIPGLSAASDRAKIAPNVTFDADEPLDSGYPRNVPNRAEVESSEPETVADKLIADLKLNGFSIT
jgi:hypothetical protein